MPRLQASAAVMLMMMSPIAAAMATSVDRGAQQQAAVTTVTAVTACRQAVEASGECTFLFGRKCEACVAAAPVASRACSAALKVARAVCSTRVEVAGSSVALSAARRNIGAVVAGDKAYFAGGCYDQGPPGSSAHNQFICDNASAIIDVFAVGPGGAVVREPPRPGLALGAARGWVSAGAAGGTVVFAGGGTLGPGRHYRGAEVLDTTTGAVRVVEAALLAEPRGRWGLSAAAVGGVIFWFGGKVEVNGYGNAYMSSGVDSFDSGSGRFMPTPFNLSQVKTKVL